MLKIDGHDNAIIGVVNRINMVDVLCYSYDKIIEYGITSTPAVAVDGNVISTGKVLKPEEVITLLQNMN